MRGFCHEYKCGCIIHSVAGSIRRCAGLTSRSCSGRMLPKPDGAELRHANAMNPSDQMKDPVIRRYEVADIMP